MSMMHQSLIHKFKIATIGNRLISGGASSLLRRLCTAPEICENVDDHTLFTAPEIKLAKYRVNQHQLYEMISEAKSSDNVPEILHWLTEENKNFNKNDLVECIKRLREFGRYNPHCLQILEWMEKGAMKCRGRDYALRISLISELKGIDEAEKYFDSLRPGMKNQHTYGALLTLYCLENMTDKALALYEKMNKVDYASNDLPFSNLMRLYISGGQPEKVPPLVQEMKKRKNIPLSNLSYRLWIQSYGYLADLEGLERVVEDVEQQKGAKNDWTVHSSLVTAYLKLGQSKKAEAALKKMEQVLDNANKLDRGRYNHLISLCADTGNLEFVTQVWNKYKSKLEVCDNASYLTILEALSKLDDIEGLQMCFKEWGSRCQSYDVKLPHVVIGAYLKKDMVEEAELLLKDATDKAGKKIRNSHLSLANYYVRKRQADSALRHFELGIDSSKAMLLQQSTFMFFEYYREERDVDGAEEFCRILEKVKPLDSEVYLCLLRTYEAAEKTAPEMRQRMEKDGVDIGIEHEELLKKVCPN